MAAKKRTMKKTKTGTAKGAKKKPGKKKKAAATTESHTITVFCGDSGCLADPDEVTVKFGDIVVFVADGTDAVVEFPAGHSPFGRRKFIIRDGDFDADRIDKESGDFDYTVACEECGVVPALPPRIIID